MNLKCICLDDTSRPNEIPISKWVKKGEQYTITRISYMNVQNRILGVKLAEINNDDMYPYTYFRLTRFGISKEDMDELVNEKPESIKEKDLDEQLIEQ